MTSRAGGPSGDGWESTGPLQRLSNDELRDTGEGAQTGAIYKVAK